jgi:hypothetical protein
VERAHRHALPDRRRIRASVPVLVCASCNSTFDLRAYGGAAFCRDCREQAESFFGKELYCDLGGGD